MTEGPAAGEVTADIVMGKNLLLIPQRRLVWIVLRSKPLFYCNLKHSKEFSCAIKVYLLLYLRVWCSKANAAENVVHHKLDGMPISRSS